MFPKWVKVSERRFNEILSTVTEAKNNRLRTNVDGREITLDNIESLLKDVSTGKIDRSEFKKKYKNIVNDVIAIVNKPIVARNQEKMIEIMSMLKEILKPSNKKSDEQPDTTDMSELESEESAEQRKNHSEQGLKILTPNQMFSRLPISLAQLKCGNNSEKFKNEIRQILHSLYRF